MCLLPGQVGGVGDWDPASGLDAFVFVRPGLSVGGSRWIRLFVFCNGVLVVLGFGDRHWCWRRWVWGPASVFERCLSSGL